MNVSSSTDAPGVLDFASAVTALGRGAETTGAMKYQAALLLALASVVAPTDVAAQGRLVRATVDSGTLIRMHPDSGPYLRGRLIAPLTPTSTLVHVCRYPAPPCTATSDSSAFQRIPTSSLARIDVQEGSNWTNGAVVGGLIGGFLFGLAGAFANGMCEESEGCASVPAYVMVGGVTFGALGALIAGGSPRWRPAL